MQFEYEVEAIPTIYRGRQYRSRLEAKWAAFFDRVGWSHEYEPFELAGWMPDFLLRGDKQQVLVEVKPITAFHPETSAKIARAAHASGFDGDLLLLGVRAGHGCLGWLGQRVDTRDWRDFDFGAAPFAWYAGASSRVDFCHPHQGFHGRMTGLYDGGCWGSATPPNADEVINQMWAAASNEVQWRPPVQST